VGVILTPFYHGKRGWGHIDPVVPLQG